MAAAVPIRTRRAARRAEIGHELLRAFERLADAGETYAGTSVDRLTSEAGISRSTFYVYFEDKSDLLAALTEEVILGLVEAAEEWWSLTDDVSRDAIERALQGIVDHYVTHRAVMLAVTEAAATDVREREAYAALVSRARDRFAHHISVGQERGSVVSSIDARHAGGWLTWMTERGLGQLVGPASGAARARLVRSLTDVVWNTLYRDVR